MVVVSPESATRSSDPFVELARYGKARNLDGIQKIALSEEARESAMLRVAVAKRLGRIGDTNAVPMLAEWMFSDSTNSVRFGSARALGKMGTAGLEPLHRGLSSDNAGLRVTIMDVLKQVAAPESAGVAAETLHLDDNAAVRRRALQTLEAIDPEASRAYAPTVERVLLEDPRSRNRSLAARVLGQIGSPVSIAALKEARGSVGLVGRWRVERAIRHLNRN